MKYPKLWNGPSAVGEGLVRALQRVRTPWLTTIAGDVVANKQGKFSEVFQGGEDGIYCLGWDDAAAKTAFTIRGTSAFTHAFIARGEWKGVSFSLPNLRPIGNGKGATVALLPDQIAQFYSSARGKKFKPLYSLSYASDPYSTFVLFFMGLGRLPAEVGTYAFGSFSLGGQAVGGKLEMSSYFVYSKDNGNTYRALATTLGPGWYGGLPLAIPLSADKTLAFTPVYMKHYDEHDDAGEDFFDNHDPYLSYMVLFDVATDSWSQIDGGDVLAFSYPAAPTPGQFDTLNQQLVREMSALAGGYTHAGGVFLVNCAYLYDRQFTAAGAEIADETLYAKLAVFHGTEAGGFVRSATVQLPFPVATGNVERMEFAGEFGCLLLPPKSRDDRHVLVVFDRDGNHVATRTLPLPAWRVSQSLLAVDERTLCVPAYTVKGETEGYYVLRSKDFGETWEPWTTITTKADRPSDSANTLANYAVVSWLRKADLPAPLTPGSPWRSDSRRLKPWDTE